MTTDLRYALGQVRRAQAYVVTGQRTEAYDALDRACDGLERAIEAAEVADAELEALFAEDVEPLPEYECGHVG